MQKSNCVKADVRKLIAHTHARTHAHTRPPRRVCSVHGGSSALVCKHAVSLSRPAWQKGSPASTHPLRTRQSHRQPWSVASAIRTMMAGLRAACASLGMMGQGAEDPGVRAEGRRPGQQPALSFRAAVSSPSTPGCVSPALTVTDLQKHHRGSEGSCCFIDLHHSLGPEVPRLLALSLTRPWAPAALAREASGATWCPGTLAEGSMWWPGQWGRPVCNLSSQ